MHSFVRHLYKGRARISIGINRHGLDAHLASGLDNAASDLATVCNQDL